jgi:hypothetical protein
VCESSKKYKGRKFTWAITTVLDSHVFGMNNKYRERKRAWSWSNHGGRILEHAREFLEHYGAEY